ncbi:MAG: metalloregulator ArsR/SmtB family transcription factor [Erythrobacter sp.]|jgi:DNA-binding transcriptional ArsR family regulator|nr:metalloregulator ArsR/SmtB family transcription factor [Erythrobacter sp.]
MEKDELIEELKAIAHPLRLRILEALGAGELNVGEIEQAAQIGQPALSQQLGVLRKAGLVETRKEAKLVFYRLAREPLSRIAAAVSALAGPTGQSGVNPRMPSPGAANFARLS